MRGAIFLFLRVFIVKKWLQWKGIFSYKGLILRNEQIHNTLDHIDVTVKNNYFFLSETFIKQHSRHSG
jgi:hypothetical protein